MNLVTQDFQRLAAYADYLRASGLKVLILVDGERLVIKEVRQACVRLAA